MEAFKFETTIQKNGVIQIPEIAKLAHQHVDIYIVVRSSSSSLPETEQAQSVTTFLNKWRGFLKGSDSDKLKSQYLQEKYG